MEKLGMEARSAVLFARIKPSLKETLTKLAKDQNTRVSELVDSIIEEWLKANASNQRKHR